ncbi:hypothetical protein EJ04DRAFT_516500 [Polyplosphaeria fusca]|uniref:Uncharacterized protein n=1 Tax=Polyplosphaeria fusca TaxID=682080 RepID=A0A9P4QP98_9PLEO|nr:hypothetical protein EJ04DRAFT_516500 [Polyplosphaeria fusca]
MSHEECTTTQEFEFDDPVTVCSQVFDTPETVKNPEATTSRVGGGDAPIDPSDPSSTRPNDRGPLTTVEIATRTSAPTALATETATTVPNGADPTPAASISSSNSSDGVSKGAVAGIAIATAVIGAAIAFLIAFLLFKRKNRRAPAMGKYGGSLPELVALSKPANSYVQVSQVPPPSSTIAAAVPNRTSAASMSNTPAFLAGVLPPAADDRTVAERVGALFLQMQSHVENFYRDVHASVTPSMEGDLARYGVDGVAMVDLLQSSSSPTSAIKHGLIAYVLNITRPEGEQSTLFPQDVIGVAMPAHDPDSNLSSAYILYRRLAVQLHASAISERSNTPSRHSDMREAAEHFSLTFFPWANPQSGDQEKDDDLVQIIKTALDLNLWLYGQPCSYDFVWETTSRRGLVIAPQIVRLSEVSGHVSSRPHVLLEPVVSAD